MPVIYIRDVKEKDVRALKVAAAQVGQGLAAYCLKVLKRHVSAQQPATPPPTEKE